MRFGLNAQRLVGQRLGVGRYLEYLIKYWSVQMRPDDVLNIYVERPFDAASLGVDDPRIRVHHLTLHGTRIGGKAWENLLLPARARENDVLFGAAYTLPVLYPGRAVVAIHSVNEQAAGAHSRWYGMTYEPLYRASAHRAARVIVPSESVRRDAVARYQLDPCKLVVIGQGADAAFMPNRDPEYLRAARVQHIGSDVPYILWVGKLSQRRNLPMMLQAFALFKQRGYPHKLLLFGPNHLDLPLHALTDHLGITADVIQTDGVSPDHRALIAVYNAADVYLNMSLYEGFSMTLVEALACGVPVVISNRGALPEIAGDAGVVVDEITPQAFADALARVVGDAALAGDLRARSVARSALWRWHGFAQATLDVLREVGSSTAPSPNSGRGNSEASSSLPP